MGAFWILIGVALAALLLAAWWIDRGVRRRGSRVINSADVWYDVRESRRDADISTYRSGRDISWSSWTRRNKNGG